MKTIGLLGGMSWESTLEYYRIINQTVRERVGGQHSAPLLLYSLDFAEIERLQRQGDWDGAGRVLAEGARRLERGGAEFLLIGANTMHRVASAVEAAVGIPLVHIADAVAAEITRAGLHTVGLLGTRFTMEEPFYRERLRSRHGVRVVVPQEAERALVHRIIYSELCQGRVLDSSRKAVVEVAEALGQDGAEGVVLGCTELPLLLGSGDVSLPVFDTLRAHALRAVELSLGTTVEDWPGEDP